MNLKNLISIIVIYAFCVIAWIVLGGVTFARTNESSFALKNSVINLYGDNLVINHPYLVYITQEIKTSKNRDGYTTSELINIENPILPEKSNVLINITLDPRKKGVLWFPTFKAEYVASYEFNISGYKDKNIFLRSELSSTDSIYKNVEISINDNKLNDIRFLVNKEKLEIEKSNEKVTLKIGYNTTGLEKFNYNITPYHNDIAQIDAFKLNINTDFHNIDFIDKTMSPTRKNSNHNGWELMWELDKSITGKDIGIIIPGKPNPGDIIPRAVFAAPFSLLFYFMIIIVISIITKEKIHPINYFFLGCAFFSFHLMYSYFSDHINIYFAFLISSIVSIFLVSSYLKLFASSKLAFIYSPVAQIIYLVVFSYSFFYKGFSGLIITIISVLSLFFIMQLTGKIDWHKIFNEEE
ncbi:MAG: inner membrane CreD family protein [Candidatus Muiribacteriota bacterium]